MPRTNDELIAALVAKDSLRTPAIIEAFQAVDRCQFVETELQSEAYADFPSPIGYDQTISQPTVVALMLEILQPQVGDSCLDIGAGSGWVAALLAHLVGPAGAVVSIERITELARSAKNRLINLGYKNIEIIVGDASRGWPTGAPYDVIHVAAGAKEMPSEMKHQLKPGGRLVIPVGAQIQELYYEKLETNGNWLEKRWPGFSFVPLVPE